LATTVGAALADDAAGVLQAAKSCVVGVGTGATAGEGAAVPTGCSFLVVGAMFTFTAATGAAPAPAGEAAEAPPVTLAIPKPLLAVGAVVFEAVAEASARGTAPVPGVPMPGNTVPACKLPSLGCAADGLAGDALAVGCAFAGFSV